jgi:hypothetical protein
MCMLNIENHRILLTKTDTYMPCMHGDHVSHVCWGFYQADHTYTSKEVYVHQNAMHVLH